ncbi:MAG: tetratricopeptide repeat protein [Flavobacteriaceae bacterium]
MKNSFEEGNYQTISKFESMLKTNSHLFFDSNEFEEIICYYLDIGNLSLAKKANSLGLKQHPGSIFLILIKIEILLLENNVMKADKLLNKIYLKDPTNSEIIIQKSKILSKQKQHEKSIKLLKNIDKSSVLYYDAISYIGNEYIFLEDFENAKINFLKCLKIDNSDTSILNKIIFCFNTLNKKEETIQFLNDFIEANPYCEIAWHHLGKQYAKNYDYNKALSAFEFAIISDESFEGAYIEMGKVLEKLKKFNEAIEKYKISIGLNGPNSFSFYRIGRCHHKLGNRDFALNYYKKTIDNDPLHANSLMKIAKYYYKKKYFKKSKKYLDKAVDIDSDKIKYLLFNVKVLGRLNQFEEFEKAFNRVLQSKELNFNSLIFLVKTLIRFDKKLNFQIKFLNSIESISDKYSGEIFYLLSALNFCNKKEIKGLFFLKNGYSKAPDKYNFYKKTFKNLPKLKYLKTLL